MLITFAFILDKILIGLGSAAVTGLFALGAKYLLLDPLDEAVGTYMGKIRRAE